MVSFEALNTPAKPAVVAPSANASSFVVTVLMPLAAAASSSSRMAIHALPIRRILEPVHQDHHDRDDDRHEDVDTATGRAG